MKQISDLPAETTPLVTDVLAIDNNSGVSKSVALSDFLKIINGLTGGTSTSTDILVFYDVSAGDAKKITLDDLLASAETTTVVTSSSSITPTGDSYRNVLEVNALAEGTTINAPSGTPANGNMLLMRFEDDGTDRAISHNAIFRAVGTTLLTTTTAGKISYELARYHGGDSKWDVISVATEA